MNTQTAVESGFTKKRIYPIKGTTEYGIYVIEKGEQPRLLKTCATLKEAHEFADMLPGYWDSLTK